MVGPSRHRAAVLGLVALAPIWAPCGCDSALKRTGGGGSIDAGASHQFDLAFPDGSAEATVVMGGAAVLQLALPVSGYSRVVDAGTGALDATRIDVISNVDLGDPSGDFAPAGSDVAEELAAEGKLAAFEWPDGRPGLALELDDGALPAFPIGRMVWTVTVLDDIDRVSAPLQVGLTVQAPDRPTVALALEIPPFGSTVPTGESLPIDAEAMPFIGQGLDFVLSLRLIPTPESGAGFDRLIVGGAIDTARVSVVADHDLGDPLAGGFAAGANVAALLGADLDVLLDGVSGEMTITLLFPDGGSFPPPLGDTLFTVAAMDDADVLSLEQSIVLRAATPVTLSGTVQAALTSKCATGPCHDNVNPAAGLRLNSGRTFGQTVRVRSGQTPDESCATDRITPYVLDASYLWHKVKDTHEDECVGGSGNKMPPSGSLTSQQLADLEAWILQGAHDH